MPQYYLLTHQNPTPESPEEWTNWCSSNGQRLITLRELYSAFKEEYAGVFGLQRTTQQVYHDPLPQGVPYHYFLTATNLVLREEIPAPGRSVFHVRFSESASGQEFSSVRDIQIRQTYPKREGTMLKRFKAALKEGKNYEKLLNGIFLSSDNSHRMYEVLSKKHLFGPRCLQISFDFPNLIRPVMREASGMGVYYYDPTKKFYRLSFIPEINLERAILWQNRPRGINDAAVLEALGFVEKLRRELPYKGSLDNLEEILSILAGATAPANLIGDKGITPPEDDLTARLDLEELAKPAQQARDPVNGPRAERFGLLDLD